MECTVIRSHGSIHLVLIALAAIGCSEHDVERIDQGKLCLYANAPESPGSEGPLQDFAVDRPLVVSVSTSDCISACIENELASCTVELDGATITVESVLAWDEPAGEQACIALCGSLGAVCSSPPLAAGAYTVVHGSTRRSLSIPSTGIAPCDR